LADLENVLNNLYAIGIEADWAWGKDVMDLDNVILNAPSNVPIPARRRYPFRLESAAAKGPGR
jgi:hypothetical protein